MTLRGAQRKGPLPVRFWRSVKKSADGCWLWSASVNTWGYGQIRDEEGRYSGAHRISWRLEYGEIPAGMSVLHRCDKPRCVRPDHLFLGKQGDNIKDKVLKARQARGTTHGSVKLTVEQVREIRAASRGRRGSPVLKELARRFGVSVATVNDVRTGKSWGGVA